MDATKNFGNQMAFHRTTISYDLSVRLTNLLSETRYNLVQRNGQRIYGPPPDWNGPRPPRGCEVFVGHLPRDVYEDELIPIFSRVGKIYELRLMMEFSGYTRGFCFVVYVNKESANRAVKMLHLLYIRPDCRINVYHSLDNSRLFIGGIPYNKTREEIWTAFSNILNGLINIIMYTDPYDKNKNRGYVFLDFLSHRHAMEARKALWPSRLVIWGVQLHAEWAVPIPIDAGLKKLYITNLNPFTRTEDLIHVIFEKTRNRNSVVHVYHRKDYAVVQFTTKQNARSALIALTGATINGNKIEVQWMKCKNRRKNANKYPRANCRQTRQKQGNNRHNTYTQHPRNPNQNSPSNSCGFQPQSSQDTSSNSTAMYMGDPLYYNSSQFQHLPPQIYANPSEGLANPFPGNSVPHLFHPCRPPNCPVSSNAFMNSVFRPFIPSTHLPVPMLNQHSEMSRVEFNDCIPPVNATGCPAQIFEAPQQPVQYAEEEFNDDVEMNDFQTNAYFVPISYDKAASPMSSSSEA